MNNEVLVRREARKDREQRRSSAPGDLPEPRLQDETRRTVDLGHSSNGPSWIDPAEIRVITTESRLGARLNCLLQQNRSLAEIRNMISGVCYAPESRLPQPTPELRSQTKRLWNKSAAERDLQPLKAAPPISPQVNRDRSATSSLCRCVSVLEKTAFN